MWRPSSPNTTQSRLRYSRRGLTNTEQRGTTVLVCGSNSVVGGKDRNWLQMFLANIAISFMGTSDRTVIKLESFFDLNVL